MHNAQVSVVVDLRDDNGASRNARAKVCDRSGTALNWKRSHVPARLHVGLPATLFALFSALHLVFCRLPFDPALFPPLAPRFPTSTPAFVACSAEKRVDRPSEKERDRRVAVTAGLGKAQTSGAPRTRRTMDWGKSLFQGGSLPPGGEHPRRYAYDDASWHDNEPSTRPLSYSSSTNAIMPCASMAVKLEPPAIQELSVNAMDLAHQHAPHQLIQPPMSDFPVFPPPGTSMMAHGYVSNSGYDPRSSQSAQTMPTLSSYFNGSQGPPSIQTPSVYFGEGARRPPSSLALESVESDSQHLDDAVRYYAAVHDFPASDPDAAMSFPPPPPPLASAVTASLLDGRSDEFGEMSTDVGGLLTPHQLNQMLVTPPSAIVLARPSALSPVSLLPGRTRLSPETCFAISPLQQQQQYLNAAVGDLSIETDPKFSPDRRKLCCIEGCKSQARAFNRCKRHGGSKRCSHTGCTKSVQSRGLCIRHGGGSRCQEAGCVRAAQSHGRCKMHGGGRPCMVEGCDKKAHLKRLCRKHGGGAKCSVTNCDKWAQRVGKCMTHSKESQRTLSISSSATSAEEISAATAAPASVTAEQDDDKRAVADAAPFEHAHV